MLRRRPGAEHRYFGRFAARRTRSSRQRRDRSVTCSRPNPAVMPWPAPP